jgi:hypothetical protein
VLGRTREGGGRHHPALPAGFTASAAPEFAPKSDAAQPCISADKYREFGVREGPHPAPALKADYLVTCKVGDAVAQRRVHHPAQHEPRGHLCPARAMGINLCRQFAIFLALLVICTVGFEEAREAPR